MSMVKRTHCTRGKAKAIVALANKLGRVAWHILAKNSEYDINQAPKPV